MGREWLNRILEILRAAGIRAGEAFPAGKRMELTGPVAAVGIRDLSCQNGTAEFEIRILSPRSLGGWCCQSAAVDAAVALEAGSVVCRMEPMEFHSGRDCYEMTIIGQMQVMEQEEIVTPERFSITIGGKQVDGVTEFSAEQDRKRRLIGTLNQPDPVGITAGTGGWKIRMVQTIPAGGEQTTEPEEPFELMLQENGLVTRFQGCCWNKVGKKLGQNGTTVEWEGFALTRTEAVDG